MEVPEVQVNTALDTLSSKAKIDKTLITKLDVILQRDKRRQHH